jgi:hypothetical protein
MTGLRALDRYARRPAPAPGTRCELCAAPIGERHRHVLERQARALRCACHACAVLFRDSQAGGGRFSTVPERVLVDPAPAVDPARPVAEAALPVRLSWLVRDQTGWSAFFPSPAGPVQAEAPPQCHADRLAAAVEPELEALLVHRRPGGSVERLLVPVDVCYELAGIVRRRWRGLHGGEEAWRAIDELFARLRARSEPLPGDRR